MKLIAKSTIFTGVGSVPPGTEFDTEQHQIDGAEASVLIARGFAVESTDTTGAEDPSPTGKTSGKGKKS